MSRDVINVNGWDRPLAFLIIDGKVYESESNHQDCLLFYYEDIGHDLKRLLDDEDAYFDMLNDLIKKTHNMKCSHDAYGFDLFKKGTNKVLVAHDKETFIINNKWIHEYSKIHNTQIGYYKSYDKNDILLIKEKEKGA